MHRKVEGIFSGGRGRGQNNKNLLLFPPKTWQKKKEKKRTKTAWTNSDLYERGEEFKLDFGPVLGTKHDAGERLLGQLAQLSVEQSQRFQRDKFGVSVVNEQHLTKDLWNRRGDKSV